MPFPRPTLGALRALVRNNFKARLPQADTLLPVSNVGVTADVLAAGLVLEFGYLDWIIDQLLPDTAERGYLARWAAIFGLAYPNGKPPSAAGGPYTFTGSNGLPIPAGTLVKRSDQFVFATQAPVTISGGVAAVTIRDPSTPPLGAAGNTAAGSTLTLVQAIAGVDAQGTVGVGGLTGGVDLESDASLRQRLLIRIRNPPQGGDPADYISWALSVPDVTRAWVYPLNRGAGTVDITFVCDNRASIIPLAGDVTAVQAAINAQRPVTADALVFAPIATALAFTIHGLLPNTVAAQNAAIAALKDLIAREATTGPNGSIQVWGDLGGGVVGVLPSPGFLAFADMDDAISQAAGVTYHLLTAPAVDQTATAAHIFTYGSTSFT